MIGPRELAAATTPGSRPDPVVLDVRWRLSGPPGRDDHAARRIPGAVFLDLDTDLATASPPGPGGRHPLPDPARLQQVLRAAGIRDHDPEQLVVAYDDADSTVAARAWWLLRWAGVAPGRIRVLDGGFRGWESAGLPVAGTDVAGTDVAGTDVTAPGGVADGPAPAGEGDVVVRPGGMPVLDADGAAALARDGVLLDARAPARYRGETEPVDPRAGHVPGARNVPAGGNAGDDGVWLSPAELAARFRAAGVGDGAPVGVYCGSGVTASALVLGLEEAGLTTPERPAALYPGSWSEWSADPARPVATGEAP
ncbi:sulfurtransferase [Pseudonocardia phyllosphaerae]|uniref:sulfurtransferase n=1 Tax=Pseudonocardia phyllosphaerae TaxID=3390502 RepID=UPI00397B3E54